MTRAEAVYMVRTNSQNIDFKMLVALLDADLYRRNGEAQLQYRPYNNVDRINHVVVVYFEKSPVGCGSFKFFDSETVEIKRMFVVPERRGMRLAARVLRELERWAAEEGCRKAVLETGLKQTEAIGLYIAVGYSRTENYGPYVEMKESICFQKDLADID
jgi:putative acetyltransferase